MIHVPVPSEARTWYQRAFPEADQVHSISGLQAVRVGDVQLEFVPSDEKVSSGPAGTVAYWQVPEFNAALAALQDLGATLYRGPLNIENGLVICQVRAPWGNCIGIKGKRS
ncbi:glyoxalase/bleomycin resistance/dioxygenase family protein [Methylocaldum sp. 0917]|jgi:predicted enzyme related to lactoylglutathione lyase